MALREQQRQKLINRRLQLSVESQEKLLLTFSQETHRVPQRETPELTENHASITVSRIAKCCSSFSQILFCFKCSSLSLHIKCEVGIFVQLNTGTLRTFFAERKTSGDLEHARSAWRVCCCYLVHHAFPTIQTSVCSNTKTDNRKERPQVCVRFKGSTINYDFMRCSKTWNAENKVLSCRSFFGNRKWMHIVASVQIFYILKILMPALPLFTRR